MKVSQEIRIQKFVENFILNLLWNLLKVVLIFFGFKSLVFIILPLVFEMILDSLFQLDINWLIIIKPSKNSEKLWKFVAVIQFFIEFLNLLNHFNEFAHDKGEDGYSK